MPVISALVLSGNIMICPSMICPSIIWCQVWEVGWHPLVVRTHHTSVWYHSVDTSGPGWEGHTHHGGHGVVSDVYQDSIPIKKQGIGKCWLQLSTTCPGKLGYYVHFPDPHEILTQCEAISEIVCYVLRLFMFVTTECFYLPKAAHRIINSESERWQMNKHSERKRTFWKLWHY